MIDFLKSNGAIITLIIAIIALIQPWLIALWKKVFRGPKLEVHHSGNLEIGYFEFGPTIAIHGALCAIHGDVFVKRLRVNLRKVQTHEQHQFAWAVFRSPIIVVNPAELPPMELPSGFIVSQSQPHRYHILLHDPEINNEIRQYLEQLPMSALDIVQRNMLTQTRGTLNYYDIYTRARTEYTERPEVINAFDHLNRACYWQAGRYIIEIHIDTNRKDSQFIKELAFELTARDADILRRNSTIMTENPFRTVAGEQAWNYNFAYPAYLE